MERREPNTISQFLGLWIRSNQFFVKVLASQHTMGIKFILLMSVVSGAIVVRTALEEPGRVQSLLNDRGKIK